MYLTQTLYRLVSKMASKIVTTLTIFIALLLPLIKAQWQPNAFEASLMDQACFNTENRPACLSSISTAVNHQGNGGPIPILNAAISGALEEASKAIAHVSKLSAVANDARENMAVLDCIELLNYSLDELRWSFEMMEKIDPAIVNLHQEESFRSWLSAAQSNQATCLEGFDGTHGHLHVPVERKVRQLTQLVSNILALHKRLRSVIPHPPSEKTGSATFDFPPKPTWLTKDDEEQMQKSGNAVHADAVVALDGTGHFTSISEAINRAPNNSTRRYVIYVKEGEYVEQVVITRMKTNIVLIGDGMNKTVISGSRSYASGWTTFRSATFAVSASGFIARDITFRNTAGPQGRQAVALRVVSDRSVFYRCSIEGYQDTLYALSLRQFYRDCNIYGTVDFIFGSGLIVVQHCNIYGRTPLPEQVITITAQSRNNQTVDSGFSFQDCFIDGTYPTYLGRPWKPYSRVVFMQSYLGPKVEPAGWLEWPENSGTDTVFYGEYMNYGPGAELSERVKWPGYHIIRDKTMAALFTVRRFFDGESWLPSTGVIFKADLDG